MYKNRIATNKKAFTLTELLIALGAIGILTAILMPIITNILPDQNALMAKRAFYTTETIISDLLNDQYCYPRIKARAGLDDGLGYTRCKKWGGEENKGALTSENAANKLVTLFSDKLDIKGSIESSGTQKTFKTKDGMFWTFSNSNNFVANNPNSYVLLMVDVNGDKGPNCGQSTAAGACSDNEKFDRFAMKIFARGKIQILDSWAIKAAKVDKNIVGKDSSGE